MAHVRVRRKQRQDLLDLGAGGVVMPGALAYDCYPQGATPAQITGAAGADTDGAAVSLVGAGSITVPYAVTHLVHGAPQAGTADRRSRYTVRQTATTGNKRILTAYETSGGASGGYANLLVRPLAVPASAAIEGLCANTAGGSLVRQVYAIVQKARVVIPDPAIMRLVASTPAVNIPSGTSVGLAITSGAGAWTYSAYSQLTAGIASWILITTVSYYINSATDFYGQVALATGAAAAEVDWGIFGQIDNAGLINARFDLPMPLLVPPNLRIAARVRGNVGSVAQAVGFEYITLPLAVN